MSACVHHVLALRPQLQRMIRRLKGCGSLPKGMRERVREREREKNVGVKCINAQGYCSGMAMWAYYLLSSLRPSGQSGHVSQD